MEMAEWRQRFGLYRLINRYTNRDWMRLSRVSILHLSTSVYCHQDRAERTELLDANMFVNTLEYFFTEMDKKKRKCWKGVSYYGANRVAKDIAEKYKY